MRFTTTQRLYLLPTHLYAHSPLHCPQKVIRTIRLRLGYSRSTPTSALLSVHTQVRRVLRRIETKNGNCSTLGLPSANWPLIAHSRRAPCSLPPCCLAMPDHFPAARPTSNPSARQIHDFMATTVPVAPPRVQLFAPARPALETVRGVIQPHLFAGPVLPWTPVFVRPIFLNGISAFPFLPFAFLFINQAMFEPLRKI